MVLAGSTTLSIGEFERSAPVMTRQPRRIIITLSTAGSSRDMAVLEFNELMTL
jgi:hypothetical protein